MVLRMTIPLHPCILHLLMKPREKLKLLRDFQAPKVFTSRSIRTAMRAGQACPVQGVTHAVSMQPKWKMIIFHFKLHC